MALIIPCLSITAILNANQDAHKILSIKTWIYRLRIVLVDSEGFQQSPLAPEVRCRLNGPNAKFENSIQKALSELSFHLSVWDSKGS